MATTDLVADLRLGTGNLRGDIGRAKGIFGGLAGSLGLGGGAGLRQLTAIGAAVGLAVEEFAKADTASRGLKTALAATGAEVDNNFTRLSAFADEMRNSTVLSATFSKQMMTLALNMGVSAEQVAEVVKAGVGLGTAVMGGDAARGVRAAALAVQGQTGELGELIPKVRAATTETQRLRAVNDVAAVGWKEAQARTNTFAGSLDTLGRSYREASAAVGSAFAPQVEKLAGMLESVTTRIAAMDESEKAALVTQTELAAGAIAGTVALGKLGQTAGRLRLLFGAATPAVGGVAVALGGLGAIFVNIAGKGETFGERLNDVWDKIGVKVGNVGDKIQGVWRGVTDAVVAMYFRMLQAFGEGDADQLFAQYSKDVDAATKAAAAAQTANTKKGVDGTVALHREGAAKIKGSIDTIPGAYRDLQKAILAGAEQAAAKEVAIAKKASAEEVMAKANARRLSDAEKDRQWTHRALERVGPNGDPTTIGTLQARMARDEAMIRRGGAPKPYHYYGKDETQDELFNERDRAAQTGLPERDDEIRKKLSRYAKGKADPSVAARVDNPDEAMRRGLGMDPKVLLEAAKTLQLGADALLNATKKNNIGVVKDQ